MLMHQVYSEYLERGRVAVNLQIDSCVAAGYTGRNQSMVQAHIDELAELGVATPYAIPAFYWICPTRLTQNGQISVVGSRTSPEVEYFLAHDVDGSLYVTVASDHTDRELESVSVGKAKQVCSKIVGDHFWRVEDIRDHWDEIQLSSTVMRDERWNPYQSGTLSQILHYENLLELVLQDSPAGKYPSILSGTLPLIDGEVVYTSACEIAMVDPVLNRSITKRYSITVVPDRS